MGTDTLCFITLSRGSEAFCSIEGHTKHDLFIIKTSTFLFSSSREPVPGLPMERNTECRKYSSVAHDTGSEDSDGTAVGFGSWGEAM